MELLLAETQKRVANYLTDLQRVLDSLCVDDICAIVAMLRSARDQARQVFVIGNGGSAATASHLACDLAKTVLGRSPNSQAKRFRVIALTDNVPLLTAWGNDGGYDQIFAEQLKALAQRDDLLIVISGSGSSPNVVEAVKVANRLGMRSIGLLGFDGGAVKPLLDRCVLAESDNYGYIEDVHMVLNHLITDHFTQELARTETDLDPRSPGQAEEVGYRADLTASPTQR
jgi:D-sedoheptulose 7-phosphate isomerase